MTPPITPERRAELRALADAAIDGPWTVHSNHFIGTPKCAFNAYVGETALSTRTAAFIAACRTEVPALLDALGAAEEALRYQHDAAYGDNGATWREALRRVTAVLGGDVLSADRDYPDRVSGLEAENARLLEALTGMLSAYDGGEAAVEAWSGNEGTMEQVDAADDAFQAAIRAGREALARVDTLKAENARLQSALDGCSVLSARVEAETVAKIVGWIGQGLDFQGPTGQRLIAALKRGEWRR